MFKRFEDLAKENKKQQLEQANHDWIVNNKEELVANYPNYWVYVVNQNVRLAHYQLEVLMQLLVNSGELEIENHFAYCNDYHFFITQLKEHLGESNG